MLPAKLFEEGTIDDDVLQPREKRNMKQNGAQSKELVGAFEGRTVQAAARAQQGTKQTCFHSRHELCDCAPPRLQNRGRRRMTVCRSRFDFFFDSNYAARSLALPYIRHATSEILFFALCLAHVTLRCCTPSCTLTISSCWTLSCTKIFQTYVMPPRWTLSCSSAHTSRYVARPFLPPPHIRHATLLDVLLHFHTYVLPRYWAFSCTATHMSRYAAGRFLEFPPIRHATLLDVVLRFHTHTHVTLRCWMLSCTSTRTSRYAAGCCFALPPIRHATPLDLLLPFHTYVMLGGWTYFCISTRTSCYAAGRSLAKKNCPRSSRDTKLQFCCGKMFGATLP